MHKFKEIEVIYFKIEYINNQLVHLFMAEDMEVRFLQLKSSLIN
jgi:hypothetical protein